MSRSESVPLSYPVHEDYGDCDPKGVRIPELKSNTVKRDWHNNWDVFCYWDVPTGLEEDWVNYLRSHHG